MTDAADFSANPLGLPIGCQTYPVRAMIAEDFPGTLRQLADAGYQSIELCSPVAYATLGFGGLAKYSGAELRGVIADAGLACDSCHFHMREMRDDHDAALTWAHDTGIRHIVVATLAGPQTPTIDDVKRAAEEYNAIAARTASAGLQQGLHNEGFELSMVDGRRTYDVLLELLDPALVKLQFQISAIGRGFDAADYFTRYPGRFNSMHVQGWNADTKTHAVVGQDSLDWRRIFTAAKLGGVENYFVEMNLDLMKASVPYLRNIR